MDYRLDSATVDLMLKLLGLIAIIIATAAFFVSRKNLRASLIISCTQRWQTILPLLDSNNRADRKSAALRYLDLSNEELYYLRYGYLPNDLVEEWISAMIYFLPHTKGDMNLNTNVRCIFKMNEAKLSMEALELYPRLQHVTKVKHSYNLSKPRERELLIKRFVSQALSYGPSPYRKWRTNLEKNVKLTVSSLSKPHSRTR